MTSIDADANVSGIGQAIPLPRRRLKVGSILGGFVMTGFFLALSAATFPVAAVYGFIWWAQH